MNDKEKTSQCCGGHGHSHDHAGIFGKNTELIFSIISGFMLLLSFVLSILGLLPAEAVIAGYIMAYFFGGYFTALEAYHGISHGEFEIDFLMLVAAAGAAVLGHWAEGALLLFLFSLGHALEHYAMEKARKSISALADLAPKTALLKKDREEIQVGIEELKLGDIIIVKPNSKISADGIVVRGNSSVNQAPITGESIPVDKSSEDNSEVFAGTINGSQSLEVKVTKLAVDSTLARLIELVNDTESQKSQTQHFTDRLQKYYVPGVLILVVLLHFAFLVVDESFSESFYRAMAVLVAASPCALAISTPSAVLSAIARAAKSGVLVKGGGPLEALGGLNALAFDKTGTLTLGKPVLNGVYAWNGSTEQEIMELAVAVERLSDHPLAAAIVKGGMEIAGKDIPSAGNLRSVTGHGVIAELRGTQVSIGNRSFFKDLKPEIATEVEKLEKEGNTTMIVSRGNVIIGLIALMDVPRAEAKETLIRLRKLGITKMILLTGDNQQVADAVGRQVGVDESWGGLLPDEKVESVAVLAKKEGKVAMIGDGVNDAPAMAKSTVGIAMGAAGSDVALETADIALMGDKLDSLPFAIALSRKSRRIIKQNLWISLGMVAVLVPLTIFGVATIGPAVIGHEGSTLIVVFNGLRLLVFRYEKQG